VSIQLRQARSHLHRVREVPTQIVDGNRPAGAPTREHLLGPVASEAAGAPSLHPDATSSTETRQTHASRATRPTAPQAALAHRGLRRLFCPCGKSCHRKHDAGPDNVRSICFFHHSTPNLQCERHPS
jgi:hypothetical protein